MAHNHTEGEMSLVRNEEHITVKKTDQLHTEKIFFMQRQGFNWTAFK